MIEFHAWATIRCSESESDEGKCDVALENLTQAFQRLEKQGRPCGIRTINGSHLAWHCGATNHWSDDVQEVFDLFSTIAKEAPGSYGVIYLWDDDDPNFENTFRVWRLAKGVISEFPDSLLSPCIPVIEDFA